MHERIDAAAGIIAWATMTAAGVRGKDPRDFMPDWQAKGKDRPEQSVDEMIAIMQGLKKRAKSEQRKAEA